MQNSQTTQLQDISGLRGRISWQADPPGKQQIRRSEGVAIYLTTVWPETSMKAVVMMPSTVTEPAELLVCSRAGGEISPGAEGSVRCFGSLFRFIGPPCNLLLAGIYTKNAMTPSGTGQIE